MLSRNGEHLYSGTYPSPAQRLIMMYMYAAGSNLLATNRHDYADRFLLQNETGKLKWVQEARKVLMGKLFGCVVALPLTLILSKNLTLLHCFL